MLLTDNLIPVPHGHSDEPEPAGFISLLSLTQAPSRARQSSSASPRAVVSQQVTQLEQKYSGRAFSSGPRGASIRPRPARMFHARCVMILREAEDYVQRTHPSGPPEPTGTLRITAPNDYGIAVVVPVVTAFTKRYPGLPRGADAKRPERWISPPAR